MNFDLKRCMDQDDGKCVTRDGLEARVICVDRKCNGNPVVALVDNGRDEKSYAFSKTGFCAGVSGRDIRNLPRKRYAVIEQDGRGNVNVTHVEESRKYAEEYASHRRTDSHVLGIFEWEDK